MAYLPHEHSHRGPAAAGPVADEPRDSDSSLAKFLIVILFLGAVGLLASAAVLQLSNRERLAQVVPSGNEIGAEVPDPARMTEWEKVQVAHRIAPRVRQFNRSLKDDPEAFGGQGNDLQRRVPRLVVNAVREELGITDLDVLDSRGIRSSPYEPPRGDTSMDHMRNRFVERTYLFTLNNVSRANIVKLALALEDLYPWLTVQQVRMHRSRDVPDDQANAPFSADFTLLWYEERHTADASD